MDAVPECPPFEVAPSTVNPTELDAASIPYVGRWNRLISTTNWEKGRIICDWRSALEEEGAPAAEYSDEAWARRVGGVSGQHVGRLRRVYQRYGATHASFEGLYWSHFQAALEWNDAEMWLEGALQNDWSVNEMRMKRWETLGAVAADKPVDPVASADVDEDFDTRNVAPLADAVNMQVAEARPADARSKADADDEDESYTDAPAKLAGETSQPFANLPELPDDLAEAVESFKLAIVRHRLDHWRSVPKEHVLDALNALRALVLSPATSA